MMPAMPDGGRLRVLAPLEATGFPVPIAIARHAVMRFRERLRPAIDYPQVCMQIKGIISGSCVTMTRPEWARQKAALWLPLGDDAAFIIVPSSVDPDELTATTCLVRSG